MKSVALKPNPTNFHRCMNSRTHNFFTCQPKKLLILQYHLAAKEIINIAVFMKKLQTSHNSCICQYQKIVVWASGASTFCLYMTLTPKMSWSSFTHIFLLLFGPSRDIHQWLMTHCQVHHSHLVSYFEVWGMCTPHFPTYTLDRNRLDCANHLGLCPWLCDCSVARQ